ncbi:MAG: 6-phospho-beta-glucosidase [Chloroflexi bacterium]|nr:6-phospho-beta-glucosidase [Chloroflexota bacterium]
MKLVVIGGAGVRTPQLIAPLVRRAGSLGLRELWLMDINADKLDLIGRLCQTLAEQQGAPFRVRLTTDAREAIQNADHIITTIRPGFEQGRATDERIAFRHRVLGQETTGAGGFAMAMRSIPAILDYARLAADLAPRAWIYNFTNPAGLVVQALHDAGFRQVVGICDSANGAQHAASRYLHIPSERIRHEVFGLNHLSWTRSVRVDPDEDGGEEVLPALLNDPRFIQSTHMAIFAPAVRELQGMFLNEYLHYFYHRDEVLSALLAKPETRGEEVLRLTTELLRRLREINPAENPDRALAVYHGLMGQRSASYMVHARQDNVAVAELPELPEDEGYAGVALDCIQSIATGKTLFTGLNVPNNGAIDGLRDDDVVEVTCRVDSTGIHPLPIGAIPEGAYLLIRTVKRYERLATQAILQRSRLLAVEALATHPLIGSYPLAVRLVDEFVEAHRPLVGDWH